MVKKEKLKSRNSHTNSPVGYASRANYSCNYFYSGIFISAVTIQEILTNSKAGENIDYTYHGNPVVHLVVS